ncbi:MAG: HNH endonuclease [Nitrospira sp.]|nr:HNH endonuclease [Nitrospira sp.]
MSNDMHTDVQRPPIREPMKRAIRQRCGFGCIFCGEPLYVYHHIALYSDERVHEQENITLLCDKHHRRFHNGLLSEQQIRNQNDHPLNLQGEFSPPFDLLYEGDKIDFTLGDVRFQDANCSADYQAIIIDDIPLLSVRFEEKHPLISVQVFDTDDRLTVYIRDNELVFKLDHWDVEFEGNRLTIRTDSREIYFIARFQPPDKITIEKAIFVVNRIVLIVRGRGFHLLNRGTIWEGLTVESPRAGLIITRHATSPFESAVVMNNTTPYTSAEECRNAIREATRHKPRRGR